MENLSNDVLNQKKNGQEEEKELSESVQVNIEMERDFYEKDGQSY